MKLTTPSQCNNKTCKNPVYQDIKPGPPKHYCSQRCRWKCGNLPRLRRKKVR